jgi:hypothetical protein
MQEALMLLSNGKFQVLRLGILTFLLIIRVWAGLKVISTFLYD